MIFVKKMSQFLLALALMVGCNNSSTEIEEECSEGKQVSSGAVQTSKHYHIGMLQFELPAVGDALPEAAFCPAYVLKLYDHKLDESTQEPQRGGLSVKSKPEVQQNHEAYHLLATLSHSCLLKMLEVQQKKHQGTQTSNKKNIFGMLRIQDNEGSTVNISFGDSPTDDIPRAEIHQHEVKVNNLPQTIEKLKTYQMSFKSPGESQILQAAPPSDSNTNRFHLAEMALLSIRIFVNEENKTKMEKLKKYEIREGASKDFFKSYIDGILHGLETVFNPKNRTEGLGPAINNGDTTFSECQVLMATAEGQEQRLGLTSCTSTDSPDPLKFGTGLTLRLDSKTERTVSLTRSTLTPVSIPGGAGALMVIDGQVVAARPGIQQTPRSATPTVADTDKEARGETTEEDTPEITGGVPLETTPPDQVIQDVQRQVGNTGGGGGTGVWEAIDSIFGSVGQLIIAKQNNDHALALAKVQRDTEQAKAQQRTDENNGGNTETNQNSGDTEANENDIPPQETTISPEQEQKIRDNFLKYLKDQGYKVIKENPGSADAQQRPGDITGCATQQENPSSP